MSKELPFGGKDEDFFAGKEDELTEVDLNNIPDDQKLEKARELSQQYIDAEQLVADLTARLSDAKAVATELKTKTLPDYFTNLGIDHLGVSTGEDGSGIDVEIVPYAHANIPKDWSDEQREEAFEHLDELESGDVVKNIVTFQFGRGDAQLVQRFLEALPGLKLDLPEPTVEKTVPWNTLTSLVKDLLKKGVAVNLEKLNATVGSVAKLKVRKIK